MSSRRNIVLAAFFSLALAAGLTAAALNWQSRQSLRNNIPAVDTAGMEAPVIALIKNTTRSVENEPSSAKSWGRLGRVFHAHNVYQAALQCYEQAIQLDADNYQWPYLAAHAQLKISKENSIRYFEIAAALSRGNEALYVTKGDVLAQLGRNDEARKAFRDAFGLNNRSSFALLGLAQLAFVEGDLAAAHKLLEQARKFTPGHNEVHALLAQVYLRQGKSGAARQSELLAKAHKDSLRVNDPVLRSMENLAVNSRAYTERGIQMAKMGDFTAAETQFRKVLTIRPGTPRDFGNIASVLSRQGKHKEAFEYFDKGLELNANDVELLGNYGLAMLDGGRLDRAGASLTRAIELDPAFAQAHFNLGILRERQGRPGDAIAHYEQALVRDPGLADAYLNLGTALATSGQLQRAIEQWRKLLLLQPENPAAIYNIGMAHSQLGQYAQAMAALEQGLALAPNSSRFVAALARELATAPTAELRDGDRALELASRLIQARPRDPLSVDLMAMALAETGRFEESIRHAEHGIALAAGNPGLANEIRMRLDLYRQNQPFHRPALLPDKGSGTEKK